MSGYTKLFGSILRSTVWKTPPHVRLVWITMLALADRDGVVDSSVPGLADAAGVDRSQCEQALAIFMAPDPDSRTPDYEGRRIEKVDGGWRLLNHGKYADKLSEEDRREKDAARQRRCRERRAQRDASRPVTPVTPVTESHAGHTMQTQMETQTQTGGGREPDDVTLRDLVARRWAVTFEANRGSLPTRDDRSVREVATWIGANATNTGRPVGDLLADMLAAYWREEWPRAKGNRPSLRNLLGQLDRLLVAHAKPENVSVEEHMARLVREQEERNAKIYGSKP